MEREERAGESPSSGRRAVTLETKNEIEKAGVPKLEAHDVVFPPSHLALTDGSSRMTSSVPDYLLTDGLISDLSRNAFPTHKKFEG